jgi:glyceraldehyde-3-phosphate dehydrogenase (NADP+)
MNAIPEEFQIKTLLNQDTYLVDGELKKKGQTSAVFSTISSKDEYEPKYWDLFHLWRKKKA